MSDDSVGGFPTTPVSPLYGSSGLHPMFLNRATMPIVATLPTLPAPYIVISALPTLPTLPAALPTLPGETFSEKTYI